MDRKQNIFKKISIVILILSLSFLSVNYFKDANTYTKQIQKSELEIKILESQLDEILTKYDSLQVKSKKNSDLLLQNEDVRSLNDYIISKNQDSIEVEKKKQIKKYEKKTKPYNKFVWNIVTDIISFDVNNTTFWFIKKSCNFY